MDKCYLSCREDTESKTYQQSIDSIKAYREQLKALYGDKWSEDTESKTLKKTKLRTEENVENPQKES